MSIEQSRLGYFLEAVAMVKRAEDQTGSILMDVREDLCRRYYKEFKKPRIPTPTGEDTPQSILEW